MYPYFISSEKNKLISVARYSRLRDSNNLFLQADFSTLFIIVLYLALTLCSDEFLIQRKQFFVFLLMIMQFHKVFSPFYFMFVIYAFFMFVSSVTYTWNIVLTFSSQLNSQLLQLQHYPYGGLGLFYNCIFIQHLLRIYYVSSVAVGGRPKNHLVSTSDMFTIQQ